MVAGGSQLAAVGKLDILLGEVEFKFKEACEVEQLFPKLLEFLCIASTKLADSETMLCRCYGIDEVGDSFGLGEVETAIKEGALGEFSRLCQSCTFIDEGLQQRLLHIKRPVS